MKYFRNRNIGGEKPQAAPELINHKKSVTISLERNAAGGDVEAFGELYTAHVEQIYRYVFYQVRDKMTAEDITEETFIKAWRAIGSCTGKEETFSAWLYRIAHNCTIDAFRSQQKQKAREMELTDEVGYTSKEIDESLKKREILEAISCLPQNQRQVIILKFIEGLDNQEIEQVTGRNQGAIRVMQMRALATLRQRLGREI